MTFAPHLELETRPVTGYRTTAEVRAAIHSAAMWSVILWLTTPKPFRYFQAVWNGERCNPEDSQREVALEAK